jgi:hypothetical protein
MIYKFELLKLMVTSKFGLLYNIYLTTFICTCMFYYIIYQLFLTCGPQTPVGL